MKHKLAVANALLPRPAMLILDEPTAGVDVVARGEIWSLLEEARHDALVLISTSYLDEAEQADRLLYLDGGRIVAAGTPAELRAAVALEVYRAWGDDGRAIARAARALPYVQGARALGRSARIEVRRDRTPGEARVLRDLAALEGGAVRVAENIPIDMESTLLALSGQA
jgi:ABC-type multidrug transport system ATPase subunit